MKSMRELPVKKHPRERGQSLVELAISFMVIALLLSGAVDLGRAYFVLIALRDAAQEGAIYASMKPTDTTGIETRIEESSSGPIDFANDPNLTFIVETEGAGGTPVFCSGFYTEDSATKANTVTVTVTYDFPITTALIQAMVPGNSITIGASSTYSILYPPC